jgi:hypothetical protein
MRLSSVCRTLGFVVGPERRVPRSPLTQWADGENAGERPVRLDPPTEHRERLVKGLAEFSQLVERGGLDMTGVQVASGLAVSLGKVEALGVGSTSSTDRPVLAWEVSIRSS